MTVPIPQRSRPTVVFQPNLATSGPPLSSKISFQLLQKEQKRYITAYSCSLSRTNIRYNCGVYGHPELAPLRWSFSVTQMVPFEQCLTWIRTRNYQPPVYSTTMHGHNLSYPILLNEPNHISYLAHGRTYTKAPLLPTDHLSETACQGEWFEYVKGQPFYHMVAYYDELHLQTTPLIVKDGTVVDQHRQLMLLCSWETGRCIAESKTYVWNLTESDYCQVAVVKEFLGQRLYANLSDPATPEGQRVAEAIISTEAGEKIWIRPLDSVSQSGRVVMATNVDEMFLFPILETNEQGDAVVDNRDQVFTRTIHPSEVDLCRYIANRDEYLYFDITSQAEKEFDTILHQDCLRRQGEVRKAHFFEQGLPGYQPFLLQDGVFSTRWGETNYRYQCVLRVVHPVSTPRCYNKLPVVLRLPQHLALNTVLNFLSSTTYFLDPDSRLLSPMSRARPCSPPSTRLIRDRSPSRPRSTRLRRPSPCRFHLPAARMTSSSTQTITREGSTNPLHWMPCKISSWRRYSRRPSHTSWHLMSITCAPKTTMPSGPWTYSQIGLQPPRTGETYSLAAGGAGWKNGEEWSVSSSDFITFMS